MTPAARVQAAIDLLDAIDSGKPAEQALTNWGRNSRYAGSKDRRAVRDLVFDALRLWRSAAATGGGETGRARMLGLLRLQQQDEEALFSGLGHGPAPLTAQEQKEGRPPEGAEGWDLPDWLAERFCESLGPDAEHTALALRSRADVFLRVNTLKCDVETAQDRLLAEAMETEPHPLSPTALKVTQGARGVARSEAFLSGLVELQDAASQAVVDALPLMPGQRVLDYCAGGGGKALAMAAALQGGAVHAHDAMPRRMSDLPQRADRAGADVRVISAPVGPFDLVLCDVPCSGSGAWRRAPEGKWRLTEDRLADLRATQAEILDHAADLVDKGGWLAYATCSVLSEENTAQVAAFCQRVPEWRVEFQKQFLPASGGDGFFIAILTRSP
jgi:16S rRNA (cytosine967-C5)-methyltransferase